MEFDTTLGDVANLHVCSFAGAPETSCGSLIGGERH